MRRMSSPCYGRVRLSGCDCSIAPPVVIFISTSIYGGVSDQTRSLITLSRVSWRHPLLITPVMAHDRFSRDQGSPEFLGVYRLSRRVFARQSEKPAWTVQEQKLSALQIRPALPTGYRV